MFVPVEDGRMLELRRLVAEGVTLPMPPAAIVAWEDRGYTVDLATGEVMPTANLAATPTPSGRAVAYLLREVTA